MLEEENVHPALMREMITSPGGTTISGLAALEDRAFRGCVIEAIEKAAQRQKNFPMMNQYQSKRQLMVERRSSPAG
jgi:pyrroline-5-carboxylate reductase